MIARADQVGEIVQALVAAGPRGLRSDHLAAQWPRAQARIGEARREGHVIRTRYDPGSGLAIYTYIRRGSAHGQHDLGLRVTWALGQRAPEARPYAASSMSGTIPDDIMEQATRAAQQAVQAVLQAHGYLDLQAEADGTQGDRDTTSTSTPEDDDDVDAIVEPQGRADDDDDVGAIVESILAASTAAPEDDVAALLDLLDM